MKTIIYLFLAGFFIVSCASNKNMVKFSETKLGDGNDSTQYELLTFDAKFDAWYEIQNTPANYRSQHYYELWNKQYVLEWNHKSMAGSHSGFFETIVGYEPVIDYGFDLNHKLFHYFMYVENVLKIPILTNGPHFFMR